MLCSWLPASFWWKGDWSTLLIGGSYPNLRRTSLRSFAVVSQYIFSRSAKTQRATLNFRLGRREAIAYSSMNLFSRVLLMRTHSGYKL